MLEGDACMKNILSTVKAKILLIGILVIVAIFISILFLLPKEDTYRSIAVKQLEGTTKIKSAEEEKEAYKGMHLTSGDDVTVFEKSNLTLMMDADKYLYAEAGTEFKVECIDGERSGKKVIHLKEGSVLIRLKNPLKEDEIYDVQTPNGTMSVRGTVFRISVARDEEDLVQTGIEVFDGKVQVDLQEENGEYNGLSEAYEAGEAGAIIGNTEFAEFVLGEDGNNTWEINYKELPQDVAEELVSYIDDGEELSIEKELLMDYTSLSEHKMETREGKEATCIEDGYQEIYCVVCNEVTETIVIPATGHRMDEWKIIKNPTCEEAGEKQRICSVCKDYSEKETIKELGHTEGEMQVVSEATCTKEGLSQMVCTVCAKVLESSKSSPLGHSYGAWSEQTKATCTVAGVEVRSCSTCGATENQEIAALGHVLSSNHEHQNLVREGTDYVSCTCITNCTREGCGETISVTATVRNSVLGIMVQYFCNNCNSQI